MTVGGSGRERLDGRLLPLVGVAACRAAVVQVRLIELAARCRAAVVLLLADEHDGAAVLLPLEGVAAGRATAVQVPPIEQAAGWRAAVVCLLADEVGGAAVRVASGLTTACDTSWKWPPATPPLCRCGWSGRRPAGAPRSG